MRGEIGVEAALAGTDLVWWSGGVATWFSRWDTWFNGTLAFLHRLLNKQSQGFQYPIYRGCKIRQESIGLPQHSRFLLSLEGGHISAKLPCDCCVNNAGRLDGPQLKKRKITSIELAGRTGSKEE